MYFLHPSRHHRAVNKQPVDFPAFHQYFGNNDGHPVSIHIEGQVHRVGTRGMGRDVLPDLVLDTCGKRGKRKSTLIGDVRHGSARSTGMGDYSNPVSLEGWLGGGRPAMGVKVFDRMDPDDAGLFEDPLIQKIRSGHGARVAQASLGPGGRSADILGEDRFMRGNFAGRFDEPMAIADCLDVKDDRPALFVLT